MSAPSEKDAGERRPCQCEAFAAVTEQAALASARWLGRGDSNSQLQAHLDRLRAEPA